MLRISGDGALVFKVILQFLLRLCARTGLSHLVLTTNSILPADVASLHETVKESDTFCRIVLQLPSCSVDSAIV